ncbi:hypothetical protein AAFO92_02865 [Roseovarius sp. CAU 1744]|uniref:hypothetical protein n=1 Tax=Roseovarius sp. CAU 1744 TaxID=3140368 RepID=UPI00325BAEAE
MSSDRKVLGIIQSATANAKGYQVKVQLNNQLGLKRQNVTLDLPSATPRYGQVRLGTPMRRLVEIIG